MVLLSTCFSIGVAVEGEAVVVLHVCAIEAALADQGVDGV